MPMEKLRIDFPIIVEGKYDKIKILSVADACVIQTDGFGVFKNSEKLALIRQLAKKSKIIIMTDSDGAGKIIRSHITSAIPKDRLIQLYTPQIQGKERRKDLPSAEGYLGVEGTDAQTLRRLLEPFSSDCYNGNSQKTEITKLDFFESGLSGGSNSTLLRDRLSDRLGLPQKMSSSALLAAVNVLLDRQEFLEIVKTL